MADTMDTATALHELVRRLLTFAMGYTDQNFFRPAGQRAPVGAVNAPYATIKIYGDELLSYNLRRFDVDDPRVAGVVSGLASSDLVEVIDGLGMFTASVQFFKDGRVDGAGRPAWGDAAQSRARILVRRMELSPTVDQANAYGLAYHTASAVRDLSDPKVDGVGERRAQVDLTFSVGDAEVAAQNMFRIVTLSMKVQQPDGHINEVS